MTGRENEIHLEGVPVSEGIAIGRLFLLNAQENVYIPEFAIGYAEVENEITRYRRAISSSRKDLKQLQKFLSKEGSYEAMSIIDTHIQMLDDPMMTTIVEEKIGMMLQNTEAVFHSVMGEYEKQFMSMQDIFFRQRLLDVKDLSQRILKHLHPKLEHQSMIPLHAVIFAKELIPSHTAEASSARVSAFLSEIGGSTSHTALIARAKGIPYVANISLEKYNHLEGVLTIVNGINGQVILNPKEETLLHFQTLRDHYQKRSVPHQDEKHLESLTEDLKKITLQANIEALADIERIHDEGAEGIGLFRTEFLFSQKDLLTVTEEEQFLIYAQILKRAAPLPVTMRVFDVGGDKGVVSHMLPDEPNPALGCRAIRFLLHQKDLFERQLRALLRASHFGELRLLFPLISDIEELRQVKRIIESLKEELIENGQTFSPHIPIGCMIEVPSAVLTCDAIASESDFLSIGTNDLIQYTLAVDRSHPILGDYYQPTHPSIIKMLKMVVDLSRPYNIPVGICGDMASNPKFIELLIGLGISSLSCSPRYVPLIKNVVRKISYKRSKTFVNKVLHLRTSEDVQLLLEERFLHLNS